MVAASFLYQASFSSSGSNGGKFKIFFPQVRFFSHFYIWDAFRLLFLQFRKSFSLLYYTGGQDIACRTAVIHLFCFGMLLFFFFLPSHCPLLFAAERRPSVSSYSHFLSCPSCRCSAVFHAAQADACCCHRSDADFPVCVSLYFKACGLALPN